MEKIKSIQAGEKISKARESKNIELRLCANLINISAIRLRDIELGNCIPTEEEFSKISQLLELNFELEEYGEIPEELPTREKVHICFASGMGKEEIEAFWKRFEELNN